VASRAWRVSQVWLFPRARIVAEGAAPFLVAPAFHVHPAADVLWRYIAPEIEREFVEIDERWREGVKVLFRKRAGNGLGAEPSRLFSYQSLINSCGCRSS
jgi:hypothetical protein